MSATPEEVVRQNLVLRMLQLGYPKHLISIEKNLRDLAPLSQEDVPYRRVDIVCFSKKKMTPLLMVECKAIDLNKNVIYQVIGYNQFVQSSFIAIANAEKILTGWYDKEENQYRFIETLPSYEQLVNALL